MHQPTLPSQSSVKQERCSHHTAGKTDPRKGGVLSTRYTQKNKLICDL